MKAVLLFLLLPLLLTSGENQTFHFHPNGNSTLCPTDVECITFNEYVNRIDTIPSNVTYYFYPGVHILNNSLFVTQRSDISFQGIGEMIEGRHEAVLESPVSIECIDLVGIDIHNCTNVLFANLTLRNCGPKGDQDNSTALLIAASSKVSLEYISIQNSSAFYGLKLINNTNINIHHSSFDTNRYYAAYVVLTGNFYM